MTRSSIPNGRREKLRRYVENHEHAIRLKSEIMVDHFIENVITPRKIGDQARAMVVTDGIQQAMSYYHAIRDYLAERGTQYKAIVAFSQANTTTETQRSRRRR